MRTSGDGRAHLGTDDEKQLTSVTCDDIIHCGTDDEQTDRTACGDGLRRCTVDEKDTVSAKPGKAFNQP